MLDPRCSVCTNRAARDVIDAAIVSGSTPADAVRLYADSLQLSRSAIYRHVRHARANALVPVWVDGETTTTDLVSGLADLRRSLIAQRSEAIERGQHSAAAQVAARIESVSVSLLREARISDDLQAQNLDYVQQIRRTLAHVVREDPAVGDAFAAKARALSFSNLADDATELVASAIAYNNTPKE